MELRWVVYRNSVTAAQVKAYADKYCMPMFEAKKKLAAQSEPVLQYRDGTGFDWQNASTVVLPYPTTTPSTFSNRD
jgi:hypothetical protein